MADLCQRTQVTLDRFAVLDAMHTHSHTARRLEGPYAILRDRPHDRLLHLASPNYLNMPRPHHQQQQHQQAQQVGARID